MAETFRNRIVETRTMRIGDIEPHPFNPRTHPQAQMEPLRGHLAETGKTRVPTAYYSERNGGRLTFTDGHGRQAINPDEVWTIAITDLTDAEADLDLAVGDPLAALAGTDAAKLDDLLRDVSTGDAALQAMLGELAEAAGIGAGVEPGAGGDEFDATPDDGPTRAQAGDLWVIGGVHRLLVGDCTDAANVARLMGGERADMLWVDPPFGIAYTGHGASKDGRANKFNPIAGDDKPDPSWLPLHLPKQGAIYLKTTWDVLREWEQATTDVCRLRAHIVWDRCSHSAGEVVGGYATQSEIILFGSVGEHKTNQFDTDVWRIARATTGAPEQRTGHPYESPVALPQRAIENSSQVGDIIADPFLGSGTTLIAAHRTGRRCYGMEIAPRYCDVILRRAEAEGLECEKLPHEGEATP